MVENGRRDAWSIFELHLERVGLGGSDAEAVRAEFEPILRIRFHHMLQVCRCKAPASLGAAFQQRGHIGPSGRIERDMRGRRFVSQDETEELAGAGCLVGGHGRL